MSGQFKSFVSEEDVEKQRQQRQADWEKVRKPDDPEECPEEETRSLFDQLKANRETDDREKDEETRLRSTVKGLDDEEVHFLNFVSNRQMQIERARNQEEKSVIEEMKSASVLKVQEQLKEKPPAAESIKQATSVAAPGRKNTQRLLLQGAIKRKSTENSTTSDVTAEKRQRSSNSEERPDAKLMSGLPTDATTNGMSSMIVAGVLPGMADYADDNDSSTENDSNSSNSEQDHQIQPGVVTRRVIQEMMNKMKDGDDDG